MTPMSQKEAATKVREAIALGYPAIADLLPDLVSSFCNSNPPAFKELAEFLRSIGGPVVPHIKRALNINDVDEGHNNILFTQVKYWPTEWIAEIAEELDDLTWYGSERLNVDTDAMWLLAKNGLGNKQSLLSLIEKKKKSCSSRLKELEKIEAFLQSNTAA